MQWTDTAPVIDVDPERYSRLLGYPRGHEMSDRAAELAAWARQWHAGHARPWICARETEPGSAVLVAVSAGAELEHEAQRLWRDEKPDEYYFLEVYGSAVVERLLEQARERLCAWAERDGRVVLPHRSPGYGGWDIAEQPALLARIAGLLPSPVEALESGALRPKKSQLALFPLAARDERTARLAAAGSCQVCSMRNCAYRRAERNA